ADVEAAALRRVGAAGGDLPHAPDALALVEALVKDVVLADVALRPVALAAGHLVTAADHELADPVAAFAGQGAVAEVQAQLHEMAAGHRRLQEETGPRPAREARVGFQVGWLLGLVHDRMCLPRVALARVGLTLRVRGIPHAEREAYSRKRLGFNPRGRPAAASSAAAAA